MITVYIWPGRDASGHAALKVGDGKGHNEYLSWWPGYGTGGLPWQKSKKARVSSGYGKKHHEGHDRWGRSDKALKKGSTTYSQTGSAQWKFKTDKLNETLIKVFIRRLREGSSTVSAKAKPGTFSLLKQNCSSTVGYALAVGGAEKYKKLPSMLWWWTPNDLLKWCKKLEKKGLFSEVRSPEDLKIKEEKRKQERQKDFMDDLLAPFGGMKH